MPSIKYTNPKVQVYISAIESLHTPSRVTKASKYNVRSQSQTVGKGKHPSSLDYAYDGPSKHSELNNHTEFELTLYLWLLENTNENDKNETKVHSVDFGY